MRHHFGYPLIAFFTFLFATHLIAQASDNTLRIKSTRGSRIIVEGAIGDSTRVNMLIDTGSTCSVLCRHVAQKLRLRTLLDSVAIYSNDRVIRHPLVIVPSIRLGPITRPLSCPAADLPTSGVDLVIGRDVLGAQSFMVDYEAHLMQFGCKTPLEHGICFDPSQPEIIVPLQVGAHEVLVKIDSGADALYLLEQKAVPWVRVDPRRFSTWISQLSGERRGMRHYLEDVRLGGVELGGVDAVILESRRNGESGQTNWQGLLGLAALSAKRVQFDFLNGIFSWER